MNRKSSATLTISAVGFIAALLIDLYLIIVYPSMLPLIAAVSLIAVVDTYFLVSGILAKVDEITGITLDKQNELTKVQKGIYSVAKREEIARTQSAEATLDMMMEIKEENEKLMREFMEQDKLMTKVALKKDADNATRIVNSNERLAVLIAQSVTANAKSSNETIEILNDICKELEEKNGKLDDTRDYSHLRVMDKAE